MHSKPVMRLGGMVAATVLALTACSSDGDEGPSPEPSEPAIVESPEPDAGTSNQDDEAAPVLVTQTFWTGSPRQEVTLELEVGPIVRDGDLAALPLEFAFVEGDSRLTTLAVLSGLVGFADRSNAGGQVRLVDPEQMTVSELAHTGEMIAADGSRGTSPGDMLSWLGFFAAPQSDHVAVLMPHFGLVPNVAVVDGDLADMEPRDDSLRTFADYDGVTGQTHDLVAWRETPHYTVDIEGEETTVSLPSDVLFDVDSAELSAEADEALRAAAAEMAGTQGGELSIVGHTDNVRDEEYNQVLSEQRAAAVYERLAELVDLDAFDDVMVTGESFLQPVAKNTSEEGRALNRRVELHFTTVTASGEQVIEGELPPPEGPVASADGSLTVVGRDGEEAELSVKSVERLGNLVVVGIRVEPRGEGMNLRWPLRTGIGGAGMLSQIGAVDLPYVAAGDQWVHPLRYFPDEAAFDEDNVEEADVNRGDYRILADAYFGASGTWHPGQSAVAYLVYPYLGVDRLTLDSPAEHDGHSQVTIQVGVNPWRFEDVLVTDMGAGDTRP